MLALIKLTVISRVGMWTVMMMINDEMMMMLIGRRRRRRMLESDADAVAEETEDHGRRHRLQWLLAFVKA